MQELSNKIIYLRGWQSKMSKSSLSPFAAGQITKLVSSNSTQLPIRQILISHTQMKGKQGHLASFRASLVVLEW